MKSHVKGSQYTILKISNKHQTKFQLTSYFFPVCEYSVPVYPTGFDFFTQIKALKKKKSQARNVCIWMLGFRVPTLQNFQFESPKMKFREFVRVPGVSDWAKFAVQISKDEAPMPLLTVELLFISVHLTCLHLTTLKIHNASQTPPKSEQRASPEVVNNSGNEATSLARIPSLFA